MKLIIRIIIKTIFTFLILSNYSSADSTDKAIYKSIDKDGNVSYSSTPPVNTDNTSEIDITPPPSDKQVKAAQERHKSNVNAGEIYDKNRQTRNEMQEEENRIRQENQASETQPEMLPNNNNHYGYPNIPRHRPVTRPPVVRPIQRPAIPRR